MRIELFHIGGFSVHGYGFMIGIGFLLALVIGCFRAKRLGLKDEAVIDIAILAGICGFAGAKVLYVIISFKDFIKNPVSVLGSSGFVVYGGIIAGVLAAAIYCKIKKLSFLQYFDLVMPEVAIAQGFGRLGCFLAGCCYGRTTDAWFGVTFPSDSMAPSGISLIPTQLFSAAGDFVIAAVLLAVAGSLHKSEKFDFDGSIGCLYLVMYGVGRFIIEFFRNDYRGAVGFLSTSQFISVFIVALGVTLAIYLHRIKIRTARS
jgi:phosphatidylglycerol:prolipoprotein diacylglycerol transferase